MYTTVRAKVLDVIKKDYDIDGRKGTSNKLQILVEQPEKFSVHTVKFDPKEFDVNVGETLDFNLEIKESLRGTTIEVISII